MKISRKNSFSPVGAVPCCFGWLSCCWRSRTLCCRLGRWRRHREPLPCASQAAPLAWLCFQTCSQTSCHISGKTCSGSGLENKGSDQCIFSLSPNFKMIVIFFEMLEKMAIISPGGAFPCCFGLLSNFCHCQRSGSRRGTQRHHHRCSSRTSSANKQTTL